MDIVHSIKSWSLPISVPDGIEVWRIGFNFPPVPISTEDLKEVSVIPNHTDEYSMECENQEWLGTKVWSLVAPIDYAATLAARHSRAPPDEME